ncbi:MAG TPA: adenylate/guanylate cyclase domain-containing protein [Acidimicrobiales bacterium]|jgi:adenylate cyclase|nr:adenylate/guanylate cyclase domain-containing protein [Acidimicrobiales bacterium]
MAEADDPLWQAAAARGITRAEFDAAYHRHGVGGVVALVGERIALPGPRRWTPEEVWDLAGVEPELALRLWQAMGFASVPEGTRFFTDADVEAVSIAATLVRNGLVKPEVAVQQTRVMSRAMRGIAAAHEDLVISGLDAMFDGADEPMVAADMIAAMGAQALAIDRLLVYLYHRHLAVEAERQSLSLETGEVGSDVVVGFSDLVGFTALSQELSEHELAVLIEDFGAAATNAIGEAGGQVVKMIGDEVMFSTTDHRAAVAAAVELSDVIRKLHDDLMVRSGLALGPVLRHEGDLFGPTVNLASRLTALARPGSVLVNEALAEELAEDDTLQQRALRPRNLKGIGRVRAFAVLPA